MSSKAVAEAAGVGDERRERLHAARRDLFVGGVGCGVSLHERVVVAEGQVVRHVEPGRGELALCRVHQVRVGGPAREGAERLVWVVVLGGPLDVVVVVLDARVVLWRVSVGDQAERVERRADRVARGRGIDAASGSERAALGERADPLGLVSLLAVGGVAGVDREVHRAARAVAGGERARGCERVDLADHRVGLVSEECVVCAPCGGERTGVEHLDSRRRLLVGELEVGELAEVEERPAPRTRDQPELCPGRPREPRRCPWPGRERVGCSPPLRRARSPARALSCQACRPACPLERAPSRRRPARSTLRTTPPRQVQIPSFLASSQPEGTAHAAGMRQFRG